VDRGVSVRVNMNTPAGFGAPVYLRAFGQWLSLGGSAATTDDVVTGSTIRNSLVDHFDINGDGLPDKVRAMGNRSDHGCSGYRRARRRTTPTSTTTACARGTTSTPPSGI
jgi:hypothetical protein